MSNKIEAQIERIQTRIEMVRTESRILSHKIERMEQQREMMGRMEGSGGRDDYFEPDEKCFIEDAEEGKSEKIDQLAKVLSNPYDDLGKSMEKYCKPAPKEQQNQQLSCSS